MREECTAWFTEITGIETPHSWQISLMEDGEPKDRLIRIPTGLGKTAGVTMAWLFNRVKQKNSAWPLRLVICLPMRTLVEQTEKSVRAWVEATGLLWSGDPMERKGKIGVHTLMGGVTSAEWQLYPEEKAILIGTQDMLLSRALNRGYAAPRARWPMEFGLLNHDVLWILDEGQLMDVGLRTSSQLQHFRNEKRGDWHRPAYSWWMSATLQSTWLRTVDNQPMIDRLAPRTLMIPSSQRTGALWNVQKPVETIRFETADDLAAAALEAHGALPDGPTGRITLVIANTVNRAREVKAAIDAARPVPLETRLVHGQFRGAEKRKWQQDFLAREFCIAGVDRIVVATQVVEAGVDISASCLISEAAPWSNLVQRFGRAGRYGGTARVIVAQPAEINEQNALPYRPNDIASALDALKQISDVSPRSLEEFEETLSVDQINALYPAVDSHVLTQKDVDELFDTTPDLTGSDLDIGRFIRSGSERDCLVFWAEWEGDLPAAELQPAPDALCPVPFLAVRDWLFKKSANNAGGAAFVFDYLGDKWSVPRQIDILPGRVVLVAAEVGGYNDTDGFTGGKRGKKERRVAVIEKPSVPPADLADAGQDNESLSTAEEYQTIATHGLHVCTTLKAIVTELLTDQSIMRLCSMAARLHDIGKAHPAFRACIRIDTEPACPDLAKAPKSAWVDMRESYRMGPASPPRKGFRHELASALALMELLARTDQQHSALLGSFRDLVEQGFLEMDPAPAVEAPVAAGDELQELDQQEFDLLAYLVCAHHGKVRCALHASPHDQDYPADDIKQMPIRGIIEEDVIPSIRVYDQEGQLCRLPALSLHLAPAHLGLSVRYGASWRERTLGLLKKHGPFALAWLETVIRAADVRASRAIIEDPLLSIGDNEAATQATSHSTTGE